MYSSISRRSLLQAGSAFGLVYLTGCGGQQQVTGDLPDVAWPTPIEAPPPPRGPIVANPPRVSPQSPPADPRPAPIPVGVLPRSRWTSTALANPANARPMGGIGFITIHHDGLPKGLYTDGESASIARLRQIKDAHVNRKAKGGERWADIGYHYIIDRAGRVWEGRPIAYQGAHVQDYNEHNIGVMCMGNFTMQSPSRPQTEALDRFVADLMRRYRVTLRNVKTHREWAATECPGPSLQAYMSRTRARGGSMALALAQTDPALVC